MSDALKEFERGCLVPLLAVCLLGLFGSAFVLLIGFFGHYMGWWDMA